MKYKFDYMLKNRLLCLYGCYTPKKLGKLLNIFYSNSESSTVLYYCVYKNLVDSSPLNPCVSRNKCQP